MGSLPQGQQIADEEELLDGDLDIDQGQYELGDTEDLATRFLTALAIVVENVFVLDVHFAQVQNYRFLAFFLLVGHQGERFLILPHERVYQGQTHTEHLGKVHVLV